MRQAVCRAEEVENGAMVTAKVGPIPVVVMRDREGALYCMVDKCLHHGAPLSRGRLDSAFVKGEFVGDYQFDPDRLGIRCPWHGYEYDVTDGSLVTDRSRCVRTFTVAEEDGQIFVETS